MRDVTVTYVEVSGDLRHAKVHVSVMGTETKQELSVRGLQNAAGFLQSKIANRVEMRYTPKLSFVLDQGVKRSIEISRILKQVLPEQETSSPAETDAEAAEPEAESPGRPGSRIAGSRAHGYGVGSCPPAGAVPAAGDGQRRTVAAASLASRGSRHFPPCRAYRAHGWKRHEPYPIDHGWRQFPPCRE